MTPRLLEVLLLLGPMIVGAVATRVYPLPIRNFQAVYLLLGAAWVGIHSYFFPHVSLLVPILILVAGELFMFLMMGLIGTGLGNANYASLLVAVGLFPWHLGVKIGLVYVMCAFLFSAITAWVKFKMASRKHQVKAARPEALKKKLSEEDYQDFAKRASVIFSLPIALAAFLVVSFTY